MIVLSSLVNATPHVLAARVALELIQPTHVSNAAETHSVTQMETAFATTTTQDHLVKSTMDPVILAVNPPVPDHTPITATHAAPMLIVTSTASAYATTTTVDQTVTYTEAIVTAPVAHALAHRLPTVLTAREWDYSMPMPMETVHAIVLTDSRDVTARPIMANVTSSVRDVSDLTKPTAPSVATIPIVTKQTEDAHYTPASPVSHTVLNALKTAPLRPQLASSARTDTTLATITRATNVTNAVETVVAQDARTVLPATLVSTWKTVRALSAISPVLTAQVHPLMNVHYVDQTPHSQLSTDLITVSVTMD